MSNESSFIDRCMPYQVRTSCGHVGAVDRTPWTCGDCGREGLTYQQWCPACSVTMATIRDMSERIRPTLEALAPHDTRDSTRPGWNLCGCCMTPEHPMFGKGEDPEKT